MNAIVLGATGAVGKDLVNILLDDDDVPQVEIFVRKSLDKQHNKLVEHIIDFEKPEQWKKLVKGDVLFSCLGTTLKAAGSKEAQWKIDYHYQYLFAQIAKENGVNSYVLVSSAFANASSSLFYFKMKGQLDEAVIKLGFLRTIIFFPPSLLRKNTDRTSEVIGNKVISFLNKLGLLRSRKPMLTEDLATAMLQATKQLPNGVHQLKASAVYELIR